MLGGRPQGLSEPETGTGSDPGSWCTPLAIMHVDEPMGEPFFRLFQLFSPLSAAKESTRPRLAMPDQQEFGESRAWPGTRITAVSPARSSRCSVRLPARIHGMERHSPRPRSDSRTTRHTRSGFAGWNSSVRARSDCPREHLSLHPNCHARNHSPADVCGMSPSFSRTDSCSM